MFSLSTCLAFSTWLCLCPYHTHAVSASTSRQRLQSLLSLSSYSSSVIPESKEYTDWPPVGGSGQSNDGNRSETVNSYHQFYQTFYGTPEAVNNLERTYGPTGREKVLTTQNIQQKLEDVRRANDHFLKIRSRAECKTPRPQVVRVKDYYPDISKYYVPHCTILHRCPTRQVVVKMDYTDVVHYR
ncbi:uncharacterized protein LOC143231738 [Tachypleus tridentatus]|uniref:uncharacterized protein LOC143231738 n=1 Tax=Tachypleus tridentatus TaxID=6853 RepID=UPI003FD1BDDC